MDIPPEEKYFPKADETAHKIEVLRQETSRSLAARNKEREDNAMVVYRGVKYYRDIILLVFYPRLEQQTISLYNSPYYRTDEGVEVYYYTPQGEMILVPSRKLYRPELARGEGEFPNTWELSGSFIKGNPAPLLLAIKKFLGNKLDAFVELITQRFAEGVKETFPDLTDISKF